MNLFFYCLSFYYRSCHGHLPLSPLLGLCVFFSSPWSRDISFFARVYYSCLFSQTVFKVLLSQYSLHEPVLWTSSLPLPGYFSIPSDWCRVVDFLKNCTTKSKTQNFLHVLLVFRSVGKNTPRQPDRVPCSAIQEPLGVPDHGGMPLSWALCS